MAKNSESKAHCQQGNLEVGGPAWNVGLKPPARMEAADGLGQIINQPSAQLSTIGVCQSPLGLDPGAWHTL